MVPSLDRLQKIFRLEAERGYDNHAVVGGLERMLDHWEADARIDQVPEELIQAIITRLRDYARLSGNSRKETLEGLWRRVQRSVNPNTANASGGESVSTIPFQGPSAESPDAWLEGPAETLPDQAPTLKTEPAPELSAPEQRAVGQVPVRIASRSVRVGEPAALNASVTVLPGVGPRNAKTLSRLGITTLRDMLYHFPRRYDDYSRMAPINRLQYGQVYSVVGTVQSIANRSLRGGKIQISEAILQDGSGALRLVWFNPWVARRLQPEMQITVSGKVEQYLGRLVMNNPEWEPVEQQNLSTNRIVPIYPLTAQITQQWLRKMMNQVVTYWAPQVEDPLPEEVRQAAGLPDLPTALLQAHFPDSWEDLQNAQHRLAFDEIFLLQLGVLRQKRAWQARVAQVFTAPEGWLQTQVSNLPFELTGTQQRALADVVQDLHSGHPMNRLVQGDVGSGKTIIAALAIALVTQAGAQAALLAPTSILAEQHYTNLLQVFTAPDPAGNCLLPAGQIRLLLGATPESEKQQIRDELRQGAIKLVIGTHALLEDPVTFADLQLAVIDEQHRFGVEQRALLRQKGNNPHLIVMTATPIPRSLALTVFGDLDLSIIDEMPPGRQPVSTHVLLPKERERAYTLIRSHLQEGRQAFIIYPLIEEKDNGEVKAAVEEHERLQRDIFPQFKLGLLHGRLPAMEKERVMTQFRDRDFDILVSTSVVEVGVDIPNATVMVIEGANRFGLAQLHQFRGRVGRGAEKSFCLLIPDSASESENERLNVMVSTNDGFVLAEKDLQQRGPGQFLGTRQAGYSEMQLAGLANVHVIDQARRLAQDLFSRDPELALPEHELLAAALRWAWGNRKGDIS